eukprot:TRINITY_DN13049_c0_g1_i1.p1 TRINITY_DN13049_c0_g1~~TRINITY_DN13049_c0_g1_i1.p1  ORF type:complete len:351 (-),score=62.99 TRINITY_DN13049_c0_g1_i1:87-1025(-)
MTDTTEEDPLIENGDDNDEAEATNHIDLSGFEDGEHWKTFTSLGLDINGDDEFLLRVVNAKLHESSTKSTKGKIFLSNQRLVWKGGREVLHLPMESISSFSLRAADPYAPGAIVVKDMVVVFMKPALDATYTFSVRGQSKTVFEWGTRLVTVSKHPKQAVQRLQSVVNQALVLKESKKKPTPELWSDPDHSGFLRLGIPKFLRISWHRYWVALKNNMIYYFADKERKKPAGMIYCKTFGLDRPQFEGGEFEFELFTEDKMYFLQASSEEDLLAWMSALEPCTDPKVSKPKEWKSQVSLEHIGADVTKIAIYS